MYTNEDVKNYFDLQIDMLKFMKKKQCHIGKDQRNYYHLAHRMIVKGIIY